jgi:hypothetical protein
LDSRGHLPSSALWLALSTIAETDERLARILAITSSVDSPTFSIDLETDLVFCFLWDWEFDTLPLTCYVVSSSLRPDADLVLRVLWDWEVDSLAADTERLKRLSIENSSASRYCSSLIDPNNQSIETISQVEPLIASWTNV